MRQRWLRLRETFWFVPAVLGVVALLVAQALVRLDRALLDRGVVIGDSLLYHVGASGSRDILGAIGGSMLGVAATSFSITISVLATTSSTYGPRLVRNFMADRGNQVVLGIFGATFLYSLMVLRSIRSLDADGDTFVPDIAVNVAVLLAVVDVGVLVYFIHHIAQSVQVGTLSARVRQELRDAVDLLHPEDPPTGLADVGEATLPPRRATVRATRAGVVLGIDDAAAVALATRHDLTLVLRCRPGDHVLDGDPVVDIHGGAEPSDVVTTVSELVDLGDERTPRQDILFAVEQLTEIAVRALSTGTNDPYTARNAFDDLSSELARLASRPTPPAVRTVAGRPRLVTTHVRVTECVDHVLDAVRLYAMSSPLVVRAGIRTAERIGTATTSPDVASRVSVHLARLAETCERDMTDPSGRADCIAAAAEADDRVRHHAHAVGG
ncbi:DUF2254 domain-containing protein [Rhodococcoides kroppenstedtii]|uniref:DUF2254 domain-containing protein n=1 Tax=Rhodococcoides kroppenstedtii TaxID=293050 RepID=UPI001427BD6F|nr:DUF2254 domain-containing protein [Rhodococcus kroppenstedtii]NIL80414.1 Uncharacterized protein [Rhodococcus kroppenstedtii]